MITDPETNFVYLSGLLAGEVKHKAFGQHLREILEREKILYVLLPNTKDLWCRDYKPVKAEKDRFIRFGFDPPYDLSKLYQNLSFPDLPEFGGVDRMF